MRLSRGRLEAGDDPDAVLARVVAADGEASFPGWGFFSAVASADRTLFDLFPRMQVFVEEPAMIRNQAARWWSRWSSGMGDPAASALW